MTIKSEGGSNLLRSRETNVDAAPPTSRPKFHISSFLLLIALIAFCFGRRHARSRFGNHSGGRAAAGRGIYDDRCIQKRGNREADVAFREALELCRAAITGVMAIEFAALIAFCITCLPTVASSPMSAGGEVGIIVAVVIGGIAAVAAAVGMTYYLLTRKWRLTRKAGKP